MCTNNSVSEMKDKYNCPKTKKPKMHRRILRKKATRSNRLEQFLWQELYDEYLRYNKSLSNVPQEKDTTEYYDQFCKDRPVEDADAKEALMHRFPLYCTRAITLWNHDGDIKKDFKKRYLITRPVHEQTEQFG